MDKALKITQEVQRIMGDTTVWLVGGATRDVLLGKEAKDYDFCLADTPDIMKEKIKEAGRKVFCIGEKFGTLGFKVEVDGKYELVECTVFRKEKYTPGSRKPSVEFVDDLLEDLSRRDFKFSAIAMDANGTIIDPFAGRIDILERKINCVGKSGDRFNEDPLRMLRAARFAAQLDFTVDANVIGSIRKLAPKILGISRERWNIEMDKLLVQDNFEQGLKVLQDTSLLRYMLPELFIAFQEASTWEDTIRIIKDSPATPDERWKALLTYIGRPYSHKKETRSGKMIYHNADLVSKELSIGISARLKWSNQRKTIVC